MVLLALLLPATALASDFLQTDAGAPGMTVQVNVLREAGGFLGTELVSTDCPELRVGPVSALDRAADPDSPIAGAVLSTVFYVSPDASAGTDCAVSIDGVPLDPFNDGIDNLFHIVDAAPAPVDGGTGDADGAADGVITIASSARTDGGTLVLADLDLPADTTLLFDTTDPISSSDGNEAFLPVILLVDGTATVQGIISLQGQDGGYATAAVASDGGDGGPGGAGGGVGSNCLGPAYIAGDGFTGGGGTASGTCIEFGYGGVGAAQGPDLDAGGEGIFTTIDNGALGYAGGTGGGTGVPWGTGGEGGYCCGTAGDGGFGGGGGNGHSETSGWGAGGGGFGTSGENGIGVVGGGATSSFRIGGAGLASGHLTLVPLGGGSGGAGGDSGSSIADGAGGGGGGGSLLLAAHSIALGDTAQIQAWGGDGGDTVGTNPGSSCGGGAGSGGGVLLAAGTLTGLGADSVDVHGGYGGREYYGYYSGDGGEGRLRVDGASPPSLDVGPTGAAASTWQGAAISSLDDTDLSISSAGPATLHIIDSTGTEIGTVDLAEDGSSSLWTVLGATADSYLLVLVDGDTGTMSPAGAAVLNYQPDADGDGFLATRYGGDDCDDTDASVHPGADELCDGIDNNCDGTVDEATAIDASTWYSDGDGDGYGDPDTAERSCTPAADLISTGGDCDDTNASVHPGADEVCNGIDDNCDSAIDNGAVDAGTWYGDTDGDRYGDSLDSQVQCTPDEGYVAADGDCNDDDAAFHPGAEEADCTDPNDYNCDGSVAYADADADGWAACVECNDGDPAVNPGATEICNGIDDNCNGAIDEGVSSTWYTDADADGYGDIDNPVQDCTQPKDAVEDDTDCNDADASIHPGAEDVPEDGIDQDCDGQDAIWPSDTGGTDGGASDGGGSGLGDGGGTDLGGDPGKVLGGCGGCASGGSTGGGSIQGGLLGLGLGLLGLVRRRRGGR